MGLLCTMGLVILRNIEFMVPHEAPAIRDTVPLYTAYPSGGHCNFFGTDHILGDVLTSRANKEEGSLHPLFLKVAKCRPECNRASGFSSLHHFERFFSPFLCFYSLKWVLKHWAFQTVLLLFSKDTPGAQILMVIRSLREKELPHSLHHSIHSFIHSLSTHCVSVT